MAGGRAVPQEPHLRTASERAVWSAIRSQLQPDEVLLSSVRFTDPRNGDVEADLLILMPDLGAAVIEVKGGIIAYADGQWTTTSGTYVRRIHPVEQARKAKHALRRYLDRQPEWQRPLLRTEWLLAVPTMTVTGDLGPEARRDLILDKDDLPTAMTRIRAAVAATTGREHPPDGEWLETALTLLLRIPAPATPPHGWRTTSRWFALGALAAANAAVAATTLWRLGSAALAATAAAAIAVSTLVWWLVTSRSTPARTITTGAAAAVAGLVAGAVLFSVVAPAASSTGQTCDPNYTPCVPVSRDVNCLDLRYAVTVTGTDVYGLDRDGDGVGCEIFPAPSPT